MSTRVRGVNRILEKLHNSLESESYYEAHQMYRTLYHRYCAQYLYKEALDLMYDGASTLFRNDQEKSGADLSLLYLEILEKYNISLNECHIKRISDMFSCMSNGTPERRQFLVKAVKQSINTKFKLGNPKLHLSLGQILWKEKNYSSASYHFLRSDTGLECGTMLVELHLLRGYPSEVDLFVAQAVLQYLCLHKQNEAIQVFDSYTKKHPSILAQNGPPFLLPLLNFLWLLLKAVDSRKVAQFNVICEQYKPTLKRDPIYHEYLNKIGNLFFDIPAPITQSSGFFGNILEGIFSSLAEDDPIEDSMPDLD